MKKKIFIITQNENIFLKESLENLILNLPKNVKITNVILLNSSPFGKKKNLFSKIISTINIFGINFFIFYCIKIIRSFFSERIIALLKRHKIKYYLINDDVNNSHNLNLIKKSKPDIILSLTANQIFKEKLLNIPKICCLNLHTSLLPSHRGLMPSFWAMKLNERYSGVSVFIMDKKIDTGKILCQIKFRIKNFTHYELIKKSKKIGIKCIILSIKKVLNNDFKFVKNKYKNSYNKFPSRVDVLEFKKIGKKFY